MENSREKALAVICEARMMASKGSTTKKRMVAEEQERSSWGKPKPETVVKSFRTGALLPLHTGRQINPWRKFTSVTSSAKSKRHPEREKSFSRKSRAGSQDDEAMPVPPETRLCK